ncbi:MAG: hypothetical protein LBR79_07000 [Oscillospiraceae bacterium]|nr:hypothetical protein [Oscillospiraceae bacterium]
MAFSLHYNKNHLKTWYYLRFPPASRRGKPQMIPCFYSCYDLKQSSKVNLSVYFLPAVG